MTGAATDRDPKPEEFSSVPESPCHRSARALGSTWLACDWWRAPLVRMVDAASKLPPPPNAPPGNGRQVSLPRDRSRPKPDEFWSMAVRPDPERRGGLLALAETRV